jgi:hypothetical protein
MCRDVEKLNRRYPVCVLQIYLERMINLAHWWKEWIFERADGKGVCEKGRVGNQFSNKMFSKDEM